MRLNHWALAATAAIALSGCRLFDNDEVLIGQSNDTLVLTSSGRLLSFNGSNPALGSSVNATIALPAGETLVGMDTRPADGQLYVVSRTAANAAKVYRINTASAALEAELALTNATSGAPITLASGAVDVDFNPVADRLRIVDSAGQNLRVNLGAPTSNTTVDTAITTTNLLGAAYTNSFSTTCQTELYYVNGTSLFLSPNPNGGTVRFIGNLGVTATDAAFDIKTGADGSNTLRAALTISGASALVDIDVATGVATTRGAVPLMAGETVLGLATTLPSSAPAQVGSLLALTTSNNLISFNPSPAGSPGRLCSTAAVSGVDASDTLVGIDTRPADGNLYALARTSGSNAGVLYRINAQGVASNRTALTGTGAVLSGTSFAVDFNPVPDRLRVVSNTGQNLRIDVDTGAVAADSALSIAAGGMAADAAGVTAVAYTNSIADGGVAAVTQSTALFAINSATDKLVRIGDNPATGGACPASTGNPNCGVVTAIGNLGVDIGNANGFEVDARNGTALLAATAASGTTSLFTVNLGTGAATAAGNFSTPLVGLTSNGAVTARVFGVTTTNTLISFLPDTPGTVNTIGAVGVPSGETVLGIDFRPSVGARNGELIAFTSANRLYRVNTDTAAATLVSTLSTALTSATAEQGVDFNPVPDRFRIVNDSQQNLRVNADTGAVTTDTSQGVDGFIGTAYTNSFTTTASTQIFYIVDAAGASSTLRTATDPNNASVNTTIGNLGTDFSKIGDLDIAGGQNGFVLAVLEADAAPGSSGLFRVDTSSGAATLVGNLPVAVGAVRAMSIQLR